MLMKKIKLKMPEHSDSLFDVEASLKFDSPLALFEMGLFEYQ
jgi:hypothetical protein